MYSIKLNPELLKKLELKTLVAKRKFLSNSQGIHRSNKKGYGLEFADYRQYEQGDDPRHIDWGIFSRTEKYIVKTFQEELSIHFHIIVDSTKSMQTFGKIERALELAGLLAYQALGQNDSSQIVLPGRGMTPKISSLKNFNSLLDLKKLNWKKEPEDFVTETKKSLDLAKFPCVIVLISDFMYEVAPLKNLLNYCQSRRFDCFGIQVLSQEEVTPSFLNSNLVDNETGKKLPFSSGMTKEYSHVFEKHQLDLANAFKTSGSKLAKFISENPLKENLFEQLFQIGLFK